MPSGACDCHVFDPRFLFSPRRSYTPCPALVKDLLLFKQRIGIDRLVVVQPSLYHHRDPGRVDPVDVARQRMLMGQP